MADWDTVLTIDGTAYDLAGRIAAQIYIDSWGWDLDGDASLEFHELTMPGSCVPRWSGSKLVSLSLELAGVSSTVASGQITQVQPFFEESGPKARGLGFGYQVQGLKFMGNQLPVVAIDGTNAMMFNLNPVDDADDYIEAEAGLSVGTIISQVLTQHAAALAAIGITTDATTTAQLAALTLVPPEPVIVGGSRLLQATEAATLQKWARNYALYIGGDGLVRVLDTTGGTAVTLTYGSDPIHYPTFARDWTDCATRVQVVGKGKIFPAYVSLVHGDLGAVWSGANQTAWKWDDYAKPKDAYVIGTITGGNVLGPTSVRVTPAGSTTFWSTNFWSDRKAWIYLRKAIGTGLTYQEARPVTACTSLTAGAGNTSDITLGFDLENAGASAYDSFTLIGNVAELGAGGLNSVWRLLNITDPGGQIANHLVKRFPTPVTFMNYTGNATQQTNFPQALIVKGGITYPATFKVLPATGQILFDEPIPAGYTSQANLNTGGASVSAPDDIYCLLAYSRGALTATAPADISGVPQYEGKAFTLDGLQRTRTIPVESWVYSGNQAQMQQLAQMYLDSMKDGVTQGSVVCNALLSSVVSPRVLLSVASTSGTTGYEALAVPVRSVRFDLADDGRSIGRTAVRCSSRRNPRTGDRYYCHPTTIGQVGFKFNWDPAAAINPAALAGPAVSESHSDE